MNTVIIDCSAIRDRNSFHDVFAGAPSFPAWYGRNLDALHDLLTAISIETTLRLVCWDHAQTALAGYGNAAKKVLTHASACNPNLTIEYC